MSVTAQPIAPPAAGRPWRRLALAAGAVAIVAACMMLVVGWFAGLVRTVLVGLELEAPK